MDVLPKHLLDIGRSLKHLTFSEKQDRNKYSRSLSKFQVLIPNLEIGEQHCKLRNLKKHSQNIGKAIDESLRN